MFSGDADQIPWETAMTSSELPGLDISEASQPLRGRFKMGLMQSFIKNFTSTLSVRYSLRRKVLN
jgi:hypothetical protein